MKPNSWNPLPEARTNQGSFLSWETSLARPRQAHLKWLFQTCFDPNATSYSRPAGLRLAWLIEAESNQASPKKKKKEAAHDWLAAVLGSAGLNRCFANLVRLKDDRLPEHVSDSIDFNQNFVFSRAVKSQVISGAQG